MPTSSDHPGSPEPIRCAFCPGVLERIHRAEIQLAQLQDRYKDANQELDRLIAWVRADSERSRWFYQVEHDLRDMVESKRWVFMSKRAVGWIVGTLVGALLTWHQIEEWLNAHKFWGP